MQPPFGILALGAAILAANLYRSRGIDPATGFDYVKIAGLLLAGLTFGIIVHRSRFAFLQGFREPFASGNADQAKAMVIAVIVSVIGLRAQVEGSA
jgi:hypothetical protein